MSERMTVEEWHQQLKKGSVDIRHILWDWQNDRVELEATADSRLRLLKRLHESGILDSGIPMHDPGECEDCDLVREVEKELADDNNGEGVS